MKEMQFSINIQATAVKVWATLWQDETFRQWAGVIDPGTYMLGELVEGNEVQFISAENGYGVTSLVHRLVPNQYIEFWHKADTQNTGTQSREEQWTGGKETYTLTESERGVTLTTTFDVPPELEEYFDMAYPKALTIIKQLAETP